jgi:hypothetical protein
LDIEEIVCWYEIISWDLKWILVQIDKYLSVEVSTNAVSKESRENLAFIILINMYFNT